MLLNQRVLTEDSGTAFPESRAVSKRELIRDIRTSEDILKSLISYPQSVSKNSTYGHTCELVLSLVARMFPMGGRDPSHSP